MRSVLELRHAYNDAATAVQFAADAVEQAPDDADGTSLQKTLDETVERAKAIQAELEKREALDKVKSAFKAVDVPDEENEPESRARRPAGTTKVDEPDMYSLERNLAGEGSFFSDLYSHEVKRGSNQAAEKRIRDHHAYEIGKMPEKRAIATSTLGGILPPAYLLDLYAKAARNGRVFANQVNSQPLPDTGMSVIIPRLTVGLATGVQASENTTVTTQDPTEVDLSVPVRTLAGYSPVSRQTIERNAYGDAILFEDLMARDAALLDTQCLNGSGAAGQMLGLLGTSGIASSSTATATYVAIYPKIMDVIQQINSNFGGLGFTADKMFMHPRRWGFFMAALDGTNNRPLIVPQAVNTALGMSSGAFNPLAEGETNLYGFVGFMAGLQVFTDANIPTTLGGGTEDRIIIVSSRVSHLWERPQDPVTLSFEQTTGTSLQINLVIYRYAAFTAGRYPGACGAVSGAGLVTPTF